MDPNQVRELYDKYFYYIIAGSLIFGAIIGLLPLVLGLKRGHRNLGIIAWIATLVTAGLSPLLGLIVAIVFLVIILLRPRPSASSETATNSDLVA